MDIFYRDNLGNLKFNFKNIECDFYLKKNGKIKYYPLNPLSKYLCVLNGKLLFNISNYPFYTFNDDYVIKSLLILSFIQKNSNLKYINTNKDTFLYNNNLTENIILDLIFIESKLIKKLTNLNILSFHYLILRFQNSDSIKDKDLMVELFYTSYINLILKDEIKKKYNIDISIYFANYNKLYLFLKEKGYVTEFYNKYYEIIINNSKKIYNKYINANNIELNKYKMKKKKLIKNFNDLNLENYIDNLIGNNLNKNYIKYKFIELKKKYNI